MKKKSIAVFISGRGSNFRAIYEEIERGNINGEIVALISDNPDAQGLRYGKEKGIEGRVFQWTRGEPRDRFFQGIMDYLDQRGVDLIVLAGFMLVLSKNIIERYRNRIVNIHPALLPSFPGEEAQRQAFEYGVKYSGCTVHFVDEGVDTGPIIQQRVVPVRDDDNTETLAARILVQEHQLFPEVVRLFCEDKLEIVGRRVLVKK